MSLDINVMTAKVLTDDAGKLIGLQYPLSYDIGGKVFHDYLTDIGYGHEQYGNHIILTDEQVDKLIRFIGRHEVYDHDGLLSAINRARMNGETVFLEADW